MAGQTFLGRFVGGLFYMCANDQIMHFTNAFSSNSYTVNLEISRNYGETYIEEKGLIIPEVNS